MYSLLVLYLNSCLLTFSLFFPISLHLIISRVSQLTLIYLSIFAWFVLVIVSIIIVLLFFLSFIPLILFVFVPPLSFSPFICLFFYVFLISSQYYSSLSFDFFFSLFPCLLLRPIIIFTSIHYASSIINPIIYTRTRTRTHTHTYRQGSY